MGLRQLHKLPGHCQPVIEAPVLTNRRFPALACSPIPGLIAVLLFKLSIGLEPGVYGSTRVAHDTNNVNIFGTAKVSFEKFMVTSSFESKCGGTAMLEIRIVPIGMILLLQDEIVIQINQRTQKIVNLGA